ncbi:MAG: hypothetical protein AAGK14_11080 [Verrucomicrobiota bacterium]
MPASRSVWDRILRVYFAFQLGFFFLVSFFLPAPELDAESDVPVALLPLTFALIFLLGTLCLALEGVTLWVYRLITQRRHRSRVPLYLLVWGAGQLLMAASILMLMLMGVRQNFEDILLSVAWGLGFLASGGLGAAFFWRGKTPHKG